MKILKLKLQKKLQQDLSTKNYLAVVVQRMENDKIDIHTKWNYKS